MSEVEGLSGDLFFAPLYARQEYWGGGVFILWNKQWAERKQIIGTFIFAH